MKKLILASAITMALATSGAFAAEQSAFAGGSTAGTGYGTSASSGGAGITGGMAIESSQAQSTNTTGASASDAGDGTNNLNINAITSSTGATQQSSDSYVIGNASGQTGALTAQGGVATASASGVEGDADAGFAPANGGFGLVGGIGGASAESQSGQASGGLTGATKIGSTDLVTVSGAGNVTTAGASTNADFDPATGASTLQQDSYSNAVGYNSQNIFVQSTGDANGVGGAIGGQSSASQAGTAGGAIFGNAYAPSVGADVAFNGSQQDQSSGGLVFGMTNGAATSTSGTITVGQTGSGIFADPNISSTTLTNSSYANGGALAGTANIQTGTAFGIGEANANSNGISFAGGAFTSIPTP